MNLGGYECAQVRVKLGKANYMCAISGTCNDGIICDGLVRRDALAPD